MRRRICRPTSRRRRPSRSCSTRWRRACTCASGTLARGSSRSIASDEDALRPIFIDIYSIHVLVVPQDLEADQGYPLVVDGVRSLRPVPEAVLRPGIQEPSYGSVHALVVRSEAHVDERVEGGETAAVVCREL